MFFIFLKAAVMAQNISEEDKKNHENEKITDECIRVCYDSNKELNTVPAAVYSEILKDKY